MTGDHGSQAQNQEEKQRQVEDMKNSILSQVLTQEARARCKYYRMALKYNPILDRFLIMCRTQLLLISF